MTITLYEGQARRLDVAMIPVTSIEPSIILTYPVGGETWYRGQTYNITWQAVDIGRFELLIRRYVPDWGYHTYTITRSADPDLGIYSYTVPLQYEPAQYRIRIDAWSTDGQHMRANGNVVESGFFTIQ